MNQEEIKNILKKLLFESNKRGSEEMKETGHGTYHVQSGKLSTYNNRSNASTLRYQILVFPDDKVWNGSHGQAKAQLYNDQRVFVQISDDVWDVYQGNKTATPKKIKSNESGLEKLLKEQIQVLTSQPMDPNSPLQQIFYGAPGTGKSHEIKEKTKGQKVIRTTFHPDSDYSTFVGCYKPTMDEIDAKVIPVVVKSSISLDPPGVYKEKRITYRFIKQAFLKAYLLAWKKICTQAPPHKNVSFPVGNAVYTIISVDNMGLQQKKTAIMPKSRVRYTWDNDLWKTGSFKIPTGVKSGASVQEAISNWIKENYPSCTKEDFDNGWHLLLSELKPENTISVSASKKEYDLALGESDDYVLFSTVAKNTKARIGKCYNEEDDPEGVESGIIDILNGYNVNTFDDAWKKLEKDVMKSTSALDNLITPQFLIIEEINRGNCAQIFGDLFQLLDRQKNGFSEYPIDADTDLQQEIERAFNEPGEYHLDNDIDVEGVVENYTSNYDASLSEDIQHGRILLLPSNLYIWATMNTSDQSLFPIDSAFKRRWEWKYIKIKDENKNWKIDIEHDVSDTSTGSTTKEKYDWWEFLEKINGIINNMTSSADKQLGYFFCKADNNNVISKETFVSKVLFYLWNDVFKDYGFDDASLFQYKVTEDGKETKDLTFPDFYEEDGENVNEQRVKEFIENVMNWKKDDKNDNQK